MRVSGRILLAASLAGVFTLAACTGASGPSEKQMHEALVKSANTLGGQLEDPRLQKAIGECKAGEAQVTDESGQSMDCKMLCGEKAGECDLSVKITELKKTKCTEMADKKGVFECGYTMVASSPSQWLNAAIHDGDAAGVPENTIPRSTRFKKEKGEWIVAQN
ncbi:MAG: hypothetical protein U1E87_08965 [Alphaproteobacteria bacterium]